MKKTTLSESLSQILQNKGYPDTQDAVIDPTPEEPLNSKTYQELFSLAIEGGMVEALKNREIMKEACLIPQNKPSI